MFSQFDNAQMHIADMRAEARREARATAARQQTTHAATGKVRFASFNGLFSRKSVAL